VNTTDITRTVDASPFGKTHSGRLFSRGRTGKRALSLLTLL
jgi:hypothetical protein